MLDRVVTPRVVFPDPAMRRRFKRLPATMDAGERGYAFGLVRTPRMNPRRHFCILTLRWIPMDGKPWTPPFSGAGPGGGFVDAVGLTADGRFRVVASLGMLLPQGVETGDLDLQALIDRLVQRYEWLKGPRSDEAP